MNDIMRGTFDPNSGLASQGDDNKVFAQFYMRPMNNPVASKAAGRPIVQDVPHIKIIQPGESRLSVYDQPATDADVQRFPRQWAAFQNGQKQEANGSPLSVLFPESPAIVDNLKQVGFFTVEQLAGANDTAIQNIGMGGRQWRERAIAYLATADKGKDYHALAAKVDALELRNQEKDNRIAALEAALASRSESDEPRRGPGRPRKTEAEQAA